MQVEDGSVVGGAVLSDRIEEVDDDDGVLADSPSSALPSIRA